MKNTFSRRYHLIGFKWKACLVLLPGLIFTGYVSDSGAEDILMIYRQAVATSPVLARTKASLQADEAFYAVNRSAFFPRIQINAGVSRNTADITGFGLPIDESYYSDNYSVTLTQPVFRGQDWVSLRSSEAQVRAGEKALLAAEQSLILEVSTAYFQVLTAKANERVAQRKRELLLKILEQAKAFLKVGTGDIVAVREAQARFDGAESDLIGARNEVRTTVQALVRLTHKPVGPLQDVAPFEPRGPVPDQVEPWVQAALENQPSLLEARQQLQIAENGIDFARRARWPRLDLGTGYSYSEGALLPSVEEKEAQIGLVLSFPLYRGGEIGARTRQARAQASSERYRLENLEDQVKLEVETNFLRLNDSVAQLKAAAQASTSARISMEATRKGYEVGTRSLIDLFDGIQNLANAQRNYYLAVYHHILTRIQLKTAAGLVNIKDIEDINSLLGPGMNHPDEADPLVSVPDKQD